MTSIPLVPFDPTEIGPIDLAKAKSRDLWAFLDEHAIVVIPSATLLLVAALYFGVSIPEIPNWGWVAIVVCVIFAPYAWFLGKGVASGLYNRDVELLSIVNPASGDQRLILVHPDRFEEIEVINHQNERRGADFLKRIRVNGTLAYEVDDYSEEKNIAVASWQAGETNASIRRQKVQIRRIKTSLEEEADKALELIANHPHILRQHATEVANRLVKVAEGIEVPEGGKLHESLSETIEEHDPSEELLDSPLDHVDLDGDADGGDSSDSSTSDDGGTASASPVDDDGPTSADIFERAQRLARTDGGGRDE